MFSEFHILPEVASTMAGKVDALYFFIAAVCAFFFFLVIALVTLFGIRYRRRSEDERPKPIHGSLGLEILWTAIPLFLAMVMFSWGATLYFDMFTPPAEGMNIYVVGKQWMWKIQHPEGNREINELHVPVGTPVRLIMTSEDVIHSFYVPAFRMKMDVLPGRYTTAWFEATKPGKYHLFCAEYCGTKHSQMTGSVYAMEPVDYQDWLEEESAEAQSMTEAGAQLFEKLGCGTCHLKEVDDRGPSLYGLHGKAIELWTGETIIADDGYIRESIVEPAAKIVAGFGPLMPTYKGQIDEEDLHKLVAFIKTLSLDTEEDAPESP